MIWLFALGILFFAIIFPGFRKALGVLVGLGAAVIVVWVIVEKQKDRAARSRINPSQIAIEDATLGKSTYSYKLRARLRNNSAFPLSTVDLTITIRDCVSETQSNCDIVAQTNTTIYESVPPGQVRDLDEFVFVSPEPVFRGHMSWSYYMTGVKATN